MDPEQLKWIRLCIQQKLPYYKDSHFVPYYIYADLKHSDCDAKLVSQVRIRLIFQKNFLWVRDLVQIWILLPFALALKIILRSCRIPPIFSQYPLLQTE